MTDKQIRNDSWRVETLITKIKHKSIKKPKFQRKKKWDILPRKGKNNPNEQAYIQFLYKNSHTVDPITFGEIKDNKTTIYSNIDGNNRINAIQHFMEKPFDIFPDYINDINDFINKQKHISKEDKTKIIDIFKNMSYNDIVQFKYRYYFTNKGFGDLYRDVLAQVELRDTFDDIIEKVKTKLNIDNIPFDQKVIINVNIFEGHDTNELCEIFEAINKYKTPLTKIELLASRLYQKYNFIIKDDVIKSHLLKHIKKYYENKSKGETLECFNYDDNIKINAYDFIVGLQNYLSKEYEFICTLEEERDLPLLFKIWEIVLTDSKKQFESSFTTDNVNTFIQLITTSCEILDKSIKSIYPDKINTKLFNKKCIHRINSLTKNSLCILLSCIIGYHKRKTPEKIIKFSLEKILLYHFINSDIKDKDKKDEFTNCNLIGGKHRGNVENISKQVLIDPQTLISKITKDKFGQLIKYLFTENHKPYYRYLENDTTNNYQNDKRRQLKFYELTLMFYYYKNKMPVEYLNNIFSIEHICPNSSIWVGELNKDRIGNLIPIIHNENCKRGNKHIQVYTNKNHNFFRFIGDIIPVNNYTIYNKFLDHSYRKPHVHNNEAYNNFCDKNENIYLNNFLHCLYK